MAPTLTKLPPPGPDGLHEAQFDGLRAHLNVEGDAYAIYCKNGADFTERFRKLAPLARMVPAKTDPDCELAACDEAGIPCFRTFLELSNKATLCLVAFVLLHLNGGQADADCDRGSESHPTDSHQQDRIRAFPVLRHLR